MDEHTYVEIWEFGGEVPTNYWRKKESKTGHIKAGKGKSFTLPTSYLPQGGTA